MQSGQVISRMRLELELAEQQIKTLTAVCALQAKALGVVDVICRTEKGCFCEDEEANVHSKGCTYLSQVIAEAKKVGMKNDADRKIQLV